MKFKGQGEISKQNLCKKDAKAGPVIEEGLLMTFNAEKYPELVGMDSKGIKDFLGVNENKGFEKDTGSFILSNFFNIKLDGRHGFTGEKFSSCAVKKSKRAKAAGYIIYLRCRLKYTEEFHHDLPKLLNTVIDIEIKSVNEQMIVPVPE